MGAEVRAIDANDSDAVEALHRRVAASAHVDRRPERPALLDTDGDVIAHGAWNDATLMSYAEVSPDDDRHQLRVLVDPTVGQNDAVAVVEQTLSAFASHGGGRVDFWVARCDEDDGAFARGLGLEQYRELYQMRGPIPLGLDWELETRPFRPGEDDHAWLQVNNRAFAWHPDQSDWTQEILSGRMAEDWFDPEGFLLHERDGRLAGFCWTKIHRDHDPVLGEIYVIAVDPDFHGLGLGRSLTLAGLDWMAARDVRVGMLYVEADNVPAVNLYEKIGLRIYQSHVAFTAEVPGG